MKSCFQLEPLARLIYFTAQDIHNLAQKILQPLDITLEQFHTLKILALNDGLSQSELCRQAKKTAANMTRLLDRLEKKALLNRQNNPLDRRASQVLLTNKGRSLVREARSTLESIASQMHQGLTEEDELAVRAALNRINENLRAMGSSVVQQKKSTAGC